MIHKFNIHYKITILKKITGELEGQDLGVFNFDKKVLECTKSTMTKLQLKNYFN